MGADRRPGHVREGRAEKRDGDRDRGRLRAARRARSRRAHRARLCRADGAARARAEQFVAERRPGTSPTRARCRERGASWHSQRRRARRSTTSAARPPTGGRPSRCSSGARSRGHSPTGGSRHDRSALTVNGSPRTSDVDPSLSLSALLRDELGLTRLEERLRAGRVRLLLRVARRRARLLPASFPLCRRTAHRAHGRVARADGALAPGAGGVPRRGRGAVRLLHPGHGRHGRRPARARPASRATSDRARRSRATSAAAPATGRSSTLSASPRRRRA